MSAADTARALGASDKSGTWSRAAARCTIQRRDLGDAQRAARADCTLPCR